MLPMSNAHNHGTHAIWTFNDERTEDGYRVIVLISLVLISLQSIVLGTRFHWAIETPYTVAKLLLAAEFVLAWLFNVVSTWLIVFGPNDSTVCNSAMYICISFYLSNKFSIYLFYVEKSLCLQTKPRWKSPLYLFSLGLLLPFSGIAAFFLSSAVVRETNVPGACWVGVNMRGTGPLMAYDVAFSIYMCLTFTVPLWHMKDIDGDLVEVNAERDKIKSICKRTAIITTVSLCATFVNILTLIYLSTRLP
ncbi:hypothetical protein BC830DRAFT_410336 [Chytriomyces sp. MP71]|nr:hypothetical protein BC830DRAFT_410336 [Chytriomyces sp. MP71]